MDLIFRLSTKAHDHKRNQRGKDREDGCKRQSNAAELVENYEEHANDGRSNSTGLCSLFPENASNDHDQCTCAEKSISIGKQAGDYLRPKSNIKGNKAGNDGDDFAEPCKLLLICILVNELAIDILGDRSSNIDKLGINRGHNGSHKGCDHQSTDERGECLHHNLEKDHTGRGIWEQRLAIHAH